MPNLLWRASANYRPYTGVRAVDWIILHYTGSRNEDGDLSTLTSAHEPGTPSSHFVIGRDGAIWWLVRLGDVAYHAGIKVTDDVSAARAKALKPNERSYGIEICNAGPPEDYTDAQYDALGWLLPRLLNIAGISAALLPYPYRGMDARKARDAYPINDLTGFRGILGHGNIHFSKNDPGVLFDWERMFEKARLPVPFGPRGKAWDVIYRDEPSRVGREGISYA